MQAVSTAATAGILSGMNVRKLIQRRIRHSGGGVDVVADVNAAIAANVNEPGGSSSVTSRQRVVQRSGSTVVSDGETSWQPGRPKGGTK
jgi:hypothetical protein